MNWYLAKLVFRIICGDGQHTAQFDEQLRLVSGKEKQEAFLKARQIGESEQETFFNQQQQLVQWQFIDVSELYRISDLIDGAELYSRIEEKENAEVYEHVIHQKAQNIFLKSTHGILRLA
jgi:hypothetical protein